MPAEDRRIYQRVSKTERYQTSSHPHGTFSRVLLLECGHEIRRKGSTPVPYKARCLECEQVARVMAAGARAYRLSRQPFSANPYPPGEHHNAWATGWKGAQLFDQNLGGWNE